jgi:hypothetical protein
MVHLLPTATLFGQHGSHEPDDGLDHHLNVTLVKNLTNLSSYGVVPEGECCLWPSLSPSPPLGVGFWGGARWPLVFQAILSSYTLNLRYPGHDVD